MIENRLTQQHTCALPAPSEQLQMADRTSQPKAVVEHASETFNEHKTAPSAATL
jgi:hypothetical protein